MKTEAGRAEIAARALVKERPRRNLLVLIDGQKSDDMLLSAVAGITADDFTLLESLGLIEPMADAPGRAAPSTRPGAFAATMPLPLTPSPEAAAPVPAGAEPPTDYAAFTAALTQLISKELGLRGLPLTLALEKASTPEELRDVAERVLDKLRERKGEAAAEAARQSLFG
jgi:hypothetical protein